MKKFVFGALVLLALFAGALYGYPRWVLLPELRAHVAAELSDPDSAQFRNERYFGDWTRSGDYCGEVNAKNRMGGYVGYQHFQLIGGTEGKPIFTKEQPSVDICDYEKWSEGEPWWWLRW
jgi:hypothetical protein